MKKEKEENVCRDNFFVRWTKYFIDRWRVSIIILIAIFLAGIFGVFNNQRQDFPDVPVNIIFSSAVYRGASPENVEKEVVIPMEQAISSVEDVDYIESTSGNSFGSVFATMKTFEEEDLSKRAQEMRDEISKLDLPEGVDVNVETFGIGGTSVHLGIVSTNNRSQEELLPIVSELEKDLLTVSDDVKEFIMQPNNKFETRINLDAEKLSQFGLNSQVVQGVIQANIKSLPGGEVKTEEGYNKSISVDLPVKNIEDLENIDLGGPKLKDVAEIERKLVQGDIFSTAGYIKDGKAESREAVYLMAVKKNDGDIIRMSKSITDEIERQKEDGELPNDIEVYNLYDTSEIPDESISQLISSGLWGLILVLVILMFFIDLRAGLVIALILPVAFLISFAVVYFLGFTLNILVLFGMILCLGILVDNAIVIVEGMMYEIEKGATKREAALTTIRKLGPAVTSATATTVVVFIPFAMIGGIMGEIMKYIPYTIIIMMIGSYILAMSITPLFGKWILKQKEKKMKLIDYLLLSWDEDENGNPKLKKIQKYFVIPIIVFYGQMLINKIAKLYKKFIYSALKETWIKLVIGFVGLIIIVGGYVFPFRGTIGVSQMPEISVETLFIEFEFPTGMPYETKTEVLNKVHEEIIKIPRFKTYMDFFGMSDSEAGIYITLENRENGEEKDEDINDNLQEQINQAIKDYDDVTVESQVMYMGPSTDKYDVIVNIKDDSFDKLKESSEKLVNYVKEKEEVQGVVNNYEDSLLDSVKVSFDEPFGVRDLGEGIGFSPALLAINSRFSENEVGKITVREDGVSESIYLGFKEEDKNSIKQLENLAVSPVSTVNDIANIQETQSLNTIKRKDQSRYVSVQIDLKDDVNIAEFQKSVEDFLGIELDQKSVEDFLGIELDQKSGDYIAMDEERVNEIKDKDSDREVNYNKLEEWGLSKEAISFGGQFADTSTDVQRLLLVMLLAFIAVYIIIVNQFHSYVQPALIMTTVFMAIGGVFYGLAGLEILTDVDGSINLVSGLGIIALIGIAVNDAIVFIDAMNRLRKEHPEKSLSKILAQTGYLRFKPIFSTSITTILGILPIAVADPFWTGLGVAIMSGLIFSTIGTLIAVPLIYKIGVRFWAKVVLHFFKERQKNYMDLRYGKGNNN